MIATSMSGQLYLTAENVLALLSDLRIHDKEIVAVRHGYHCDEAGTVLAYLSLKDCDPRDVVLYTSKEYRPILAAALAERGIKIADDAWLALDTECRVHVYVSVDVSVG